MIRKFLYISGGNVIRQGLTFVSQLILARSLGDASFGDLTLAFSLFLVGAGVADLGTRLYSWRRVAVTPPDQRDPEALRLFWTRIKLAVTVALLLNVAVYLLAPERIAVLLHFYTLAVVVNQATFDWVLLSRGKYPSNFWFTVASGVLYIGGILFFISGPERLEWVPLVFVASYAAAGLTTLLLQFGGRWARSAGHAAPASAVVGFLREHWELFAYDLLQRTHSVAIILVASVFYAGALIGQFRVPHLIYALVAALGVYVASSVFNTVARDAVQDEDPEGIEHGMILILALFIPAGIFGDRILAEPLQLALGAQYAASTAPLRVLLSFLAVAALGNFAREISISSGHARLAVQSYLVAIALLTLLLVVHHPPDLTYLAYVLVGGELAGIAYLLVRSPYGFLTAKVFQVLAISLGVGFVLQFAWDALHRAVAGWPGYSLATVVTGLVAAAYAYVTVRRRSRESASAA